MSEQKDEIKPNDTNNKSVEQLEFQETMDLIEQRKSFFINRAIPNQSGLLSGKKNKIATLSDVVKSLRGFVSYDLPVQSTLRSLYTPQQLPSMPENENPQLRCVLPPPSSGQGSVDKINISQPSFQWLCKSITDSNLLQLDIPEPQQLAKIKKDSVPQQWTNITELLIHNIKNNIHKKQEVKEVENYLKDRLRKSRSAKIVKIKFLFYKGKPSAIVTFSNDIGCAKGYMRLTKEDKIKEGLGINASVFRVKQNKIKQMKTQKSVYIVFRRLPKDLSDNDFILQLKRYQIKILWVQRISFIDSAGYSVCKVEFLQKAFELLEKFRNNPLFPGVKVNLHKNTNKYWQSQANKFHLPGFC